MSVGKRGEPMAKIYFNSRDELTCIDTDMVAVVQANGNYSRIVYINKREITLTTGIGKMEEILKSSGGGKRNKFIRLGRSIIVNHTYFYKIDLQRQLLMLTDNGTHEIRINLSKKIIKPYKKAIVDSTKIKNSHAESNYTGNKR